MVNKEKYKILLKLVIMSCSIIFSIFGALYGANYIKAKPTFYKKLRIAIDTLSSKHMLMQNDIGFKELSDIIINYNNKNFMNYATFISETAVETVRVQQKEISGIYAIYVAYSIPCYFSITSTTKNPFPLSTNDGKFSGYYALCNLPENTPPLEEIQNFISVNKKNDLNKMYPNPIMYNNMFTIGSRESLNTQVMQYLQMEQMKYSIIYIVIGFFLAYIVIFIESILVFLHARE